LSISKESSAQESIKACKILGVEEISFSKVAIGKLESRNRSNYF
jgi:hypothetical protein